MPTVTINGGVRIDGLSAFTSEWQFSPRLNVAWEATPATTVHAGYARYFTPPRQEFVPTTSIAKFDNTTAAASVPINSPVRAERAHYLDAGITQRIIPGLKVGAGRLLQVLAVPSGRGPVRRADVPDAVQLPHGVQLSGSS